jgi:hypothetical protein
MTTSIGTAKARLGCAIRFYGRDSAETLAARREFVAAKLAAKQRELDVLRRELDQLAILADYREAAS